MQKNLIPYLTRNDFLLSIQMLYKNVSPDRTGRRFQKGEKTKSEGRKTVSQNCIHILKECLFPRAKNKGFRIPL